MTIARVLLVFFYRAIIQTVLLAMGQIWANKVRSVITAIGIIFGVGAVIAVMGALAGLNNYVLGQVESFGARKMWVWGEVPDELESTVNWTDVKLTLRELEKIQAHAPSIEKLTPLCGSSYDITFGRETVRGVRTRGIWPAWHEIEDRHVTLGRPFSRIDEEENRQVCLVNEIALEELKLNLDPVGDYLLIGQRRFLIVGVVEDKELGPMFGGGEARSEIYMPFSTSKMLNPYSWTYSMLQIVSPEVAEEAQDEIRFILRKNRNLDPETPDTFGMEVLQEHIDQFNQMASVIKVIAIAIAGVSLFVGGIGIMNIMLVSVSERTREIGLRKAVGAQPLVVLLQFLIEAVVLCVAGGAIGIALGQGFSRGLELMLSDFMKDASVEARWVWAAVGVCAGIGVFFGMIPAIKAALLNPINALRHE